LAFVYREFIVFADYVYNMFVFAL